MGDLFYFYIRSMRIKSLKILIGLLLLSGFCFSQEPEIGISNTGIRPLSAFSRNSNELIETDIYLNNEWQETTLNFIDSEKSKKYPARFNLALNVIEVKVFNTAYAVAWRDLDIVEVENKSYLPINDLDDIYFAELIYDKGNLRLFKSSVLTLEKANYNPALNTGSKYDEWNKEEIMILDVEGVFTQIKRKKDIKKALEKTTHKDKKLNISSINESNLKRLIDSLINS